MDDERLAFVEERAGGGEGESTKAAAALFEVGVPGPWQAIKRNHDETDRAPGVAWAVDPGWAREMALAGETSEFPTPGDRQHLAVFYGVRVRPEDLRWAAAV